MSQQSQSQQESREQHYQQLDKLQRQKTRRSVFLPFFLLILLMFVFVGIMLSLRTPAQVAIVSDFLFTLFILCPLIICMFPVVMLMFLLVALMNRLHIGAKSPLRRLEQWTYAAEKRVEGWASMVDSRVLNWAVRFAPVRRILTIFDAPSPDKQGEGEENDPARTE